MYTTNNLRGNATTYIKEKKFHDKTWNGDGLGLAIGDASADPRDGFSFVSQQWENYNFNHNLDVGHFQRGNILSGIKNGAGVKNRTGQKIDVEWVKGSFTITSCALNTAEAWGTNLPEAYIVPYGPGELTPHIHYIRTSIRMVIVRDLQYMSHDEWLNWNDVFESGDNEDGLGCIHSEQKVGNMGRFKILSDETVTLHGLNPITTIPFYIKGSDLGQIIYSDDSADSYSSSGLFVIWAAYVPNYWNIGGELLQDALAPPTIVGHTRVCFTDS